MAETPEISCGCINEMSKAYHTAHPGSITLLYMPCLDLKVSGFEVIERREANHVDMLPTHITTTLGENKFAPLLIRAASFVII